MKKAQAKQLAELVLAVWSTGDDPVRAAREMYEGCDEEDEMVTLATEYSTFITACANRAVRILADYIGQLDPTPKRPHKKPQQRKKPSQWPLT